MKILCRSLLKPWILSSVSYLFLVSSTCSAIDEIPAGFDDYRETYFVKVPHTTVEQVAFAIYGSSVSAKTVAAWNHLKTTDELDLEKPIILKVPSRLSYDAINTKIIAYQEAAESGRSLASLAPPPPSNQDVEKAIVLHGTDLTEEDDPRMAVQVYQGYLTRHPSTPAITKAQAEAYLKMKDYNKSLQYYRKLKNQDPKDPEPWLTEMYILKKLHSKDVRVVAQQFMEKFPEMKDLTFLDQYK